MREAIRGDVSAIKSHQERNQVQSGAQSRALRTHLSSGTGFMVLIAGSVAVYSPPADALTSFSLT
jgi:hypothetical protein